MNNLTLESLEEQVAVVRANLAQLVEEATGFSGAGNDERNAERIASEEERLASLTAQRDALGGGQTK